MPKGSAINAMEITEVRIKLMEESEDRLRAFCSITIDHAFVIRDLKIIEGVNGPFVAMPSRKMSARCGKCGNKNHLRSSYCNQCGTRLRGPQDVREVEGGGSSNKMYADIAHPINQACRDLIQNSVIREYLVELDRAKQPDYKSRYDDEYIEAAHTEVHSSQAIAHVESSAVPKPHFLDAEKKPLANPLSIQEKRNFGDGIL